MPHLRSLGELVIELGMRAQFSMMPQRTGGRRKDVAGSLVRAFAPVAFHIAIKCEWGKTARGGSETLSRTEGYDWASYCQM